MWRVAKATQRIEEKTVNEWLEMKKKLKLIGMVASREGLHQRERILQLLHYNDAILYTWFNAEVFNGKEKFLT